MSFGTEAAPRDERSTTSLLWLWIRIETPDITVRLIILWESMPEGYRLDRRLLEVQKKKGIHALRLDGFGKLHRFTHVGVTALALTKTNVAS